MGIHNVKKAKDDEDKAVKLSESSKSKEKELLSSQLPESAKPTETSKSSPAADGTVQPRPEFATRLHSQIQNMHGMLLVASKTLNDVTGYSSIEQLKKTVERLELELQQAKSSVRAAKAAYLEAISKRSDSQREINELLTRKHSWTPQDVERFTELYRSDHEYLQREKNAERNLEEAENTVDSVQVHLTTLILTRYHEEQMWSDKIRQALTWGTWALMGVNLLLFAVATLLVEPWKRKRLVSAFHDEVREKLTEFTSEIGELKAMMGLKTQHENGPTVIPNQAEAPEMFPISAVGLGQWDTLKAKVGGFVDALRQSRTVFEVPRTEFLSLGAIWVAFGFLVGTLVTSLAR